MTKLTRTSKSFSFKFVRSTKVISSLMKDIRVVKKEPKTELRKIHDMYANTYFKLEYQNSSNSFKHRPAEVCIEDARQKGFSKIFVDTSGNLGLAISQLTRKTDLILDISVNNEKYPFIETLTKNALILEQRNNTPSLISRALSVLCSVLNMWDYWWFLNNGSMFKQKSEEGYYLAQPSIYVNPISLIGYSHISWETYMQMGNNAPDCVVTPIINSDNAIGQWLGYYALYKEKKISKIPTFVLVERSKKIKHFNYPDAWRIIKKISPVQLIGVDEEGELKSKKYFRDKYGINVEGVSSATLNAYLYLRKSKQFGKKSSIVLILSGSNV